MEDVGVRGDHRAEQPSLIFAGPLESKMNQKQSVTVLIALEHNPLDSHSICKVAGSRVI